MVQFPHSDTCYKQSCWNHFTTLNFNSHFQIVSIKFGWISKSRETLIGCSIKYAMWMFVFDINAQNSKVFFTVDLTMIFCR